MITFLAGVSAAIAVGMLIWSVVTITQSNKRIKLLKKQKDTIKLEVDNRLNSIIRTLEDIERTLNDRIDENYSYTDSRFDKLENKLTNKK